MKPNYTSYSTTSTFMQPTLAPHAARYLHFVQQGPTPCSTVPTLHTTRRQGKASTKATKITLSPFLISPSLYASASAEGTLAADELPRCSIESLNSSFGACILRAAKSIISLVCLVRNDEFDLIERNTRALANLCYSQIS